MPNSILVAMGFAELTGWYYVAAYAATMYAVSYATTRIFGQKPPKLQDNGVRQQIPPATVNSLPVVYGDAYLGGVFVDDGNRWVSLRQSTDLLEISNVLATPYVLTGWTSNNTRVMTTQDTTPQDIYMTNDGSRFYYLGSASDSIYQFTL